MLILNHRILKCTALNLLTFFLILPAHAATAIPFTITMSEAVNVTGSPRIAVDVGGVTRYATYASGTGTSSLTFTYAAQAGDVDLDGVSISSPIDLNGGTITDLNGNPETNLTFTVPDTSGIKIDYPSLSMDFIADADGRYTLNGTAYNDLPALLSATSGTFTRNSTATYTDSSGVMQTASVNQPRFDYDPVTNQPKGILLEEGTTNLFINSEAFNTWAPIRTLIQADASLAPDNTMTADKVIATSEANSHSVRKTTSVNNTPVTFSVFAKSAERSRILLREDTTGSYASFDLQSGAVLTESNLVGKIINAPNGWKRIFITFTPTASGNINFWIMPLPDTGTLYGDGFVAGDDVSGLYIWGAQLEQKLFPTSYVPSTTTQGTRDNEDFYFSTASWFSPSAGTIRAKYNYLPSATHGNGGTYGRGNSVIFRFQNSSGSTYTNQFSLGRFQANGTNQPNRLGLSLRDLDGSGSDIASIFLYTVNLDSNNQAHSAVSYDTNGVTMTANNLTPVTNGTGFSNLPFTIFRLDKAYDGSYGCKHIQKLSYYPARVSDIQLRMMTQ